MTKAFNEKDYRRDPTLRRAKQQWGYQYRSFDGQPYRIGTWHKTQAAAKARAKKLRGMGYRVRVVERDDQYVIYASPFPP